MNPPPKADPDLQWILQSEDDTKKLAEFLSQKGYKSVWLVGDLGAGKSALARYWLYALGYQGKVKSPTYTLVEPYALPEPKAGVRVVYHADLYRLNDPEELEFMGFFEYFGQDSLLLIEWPSKASDLLELPDALVRIEILQDNRRRVCVFGKDALKNAPFDPSAVASQC